MKNNKLQTLSNQQMSKILRFYPNSIDISTTFFTLDRKYSCQELEDQKLPLPLGVVYLIMNIRGKAFWIFLMNLVLGKISKKEVCRKYSAIEDWIYYT